MKAYKITLLIVDDDNIGLDEAKHVLANTHYPNYCISPRVVAAEEKDIGVWSDDHPMNRDIVASENYFDSRHPVSPFKVGVDEVRLGYVSWSNTNCTDGYGSLLPIGHSFCEATADRLGRKQGVQGCDCDTTQVTMYKIGADWYGPVYMNQPSLEDEARQTKEDDKKAATERAKSLGLTDDEIKALSR